MSFKLRAAGICRLFLIMTTASELLAKMQKVDILLSAQIAMEKTADTATAIQREQLSEGKKSDGTEMPEYSFRSVFQYNKDPGPIKLYDTGAFYRGIGFDVRHDIYILESDDNKTMMLKKRYGPDILGLNVESKQKYIVTLKPVFIREVQSYLK